MVVAETMNKSVLKVTESTTSTSEDSDESDNDISETSEKEVEAENSDSNNENDGSVGETEKVIANEGWADSLAKVLGSNKPKHKKTLVLSRAKKHSEVLKRKVESKPEFEIVGEVKEESKTSEVAVKSEPVAKQKKLDKPSIRTKPNILEKDRERLLSKIATKGVVQLFNAVRMQQRKLERQSDMTETKKEKIMKKFDKRTFLDSLMGQTKSIVVDDMTKQNKEDVKDEAKPTWSALRDDFMMGAKMRDWDKETNEE